MEVDEADHRCAVVPEAPSSSLVAHQYLLAQGTELADHLLMLSDDRLSLADVEVDESHLQLPVSLRPAALFRIVFHNVL